MNLGKVAITSNGKGFYSQVFKLQGNCVQFGSMRTTLTPVERRLFKALGDAAPLRLAYKDLVKAGWDAPVFVPAIDIPKLQTAIGRLRTKVEDLGLKPLEVLPKSDRRGYYITIRVVEIAEAVAVPDQVPWLLYLRNWLGAIVAERRTRD